MPSNITLLIEEFQLHFDGLHTDAQKINFMLDGEQLFMIPVTHDMEYREYTEKHTNRNAWQNFKMKNPEEVARLNGIFGKNIEADHMHLTDEMYLDILYKIQDVVNAPGFRPDSFDDTTIGAKKTGSNCGLCNDEFTMLESALFPDDFPERKSMRYNRSHQRCPFDMREVSDGNGCFYTCYIFKTHDYENRYTCDVERMKRMVETAIQRIAPARSRLQDKLHRLKKVV